MNKTRTRSPVQEGVSSAVRQGGSQAWGNGSSDRLGYDGTGRMITRRYLGATADRERTWKSRMSPMAPKKGNAAFTLMELITVVAIITLLLAILAPSLARAKELARRGVCASNLSSIGRGAHQYGAENRERLPVTEPDSTSDIWDGSGKKPINYGILVKTSGVPAPAFYCPSAAQYTVNTPATGAQNFGIDGQSSKCSYWQRGPNQTKDKGTGDPIRMNQISMANKSIIMDYQCRAKNAGDTDKRTGERQVWTHKDFTNVLNCGGHVRGVSREEFSPYLDSKVADEFGGDSGEIKGSFKLLDEM